MAMRTTFEEVFDRTLSKINDYDFVEMSRQDFNEEFTMKMRSALSKCLCLKDVKPNYLFEEFNKTLDDLEIDIIANWMVVEYLNPKINNIELLRQRLSSKDYKEYSQANHLKELRSLRKDAENTARYWVNRYPLIKASQKGGF